MTAYLSQLPDELLLGIVSSIDDNNSLCALARVCRRFRSLSESVIYSAILLRTSQACRHLKHAIESSPRRATYIRVLDLRPEHANGIGDFGRAVTSVLLQCSGLRELTLESPTCNYRRWVSSALGWKEVEVNIPPSIMEAMRVTSTAGLAKLVLHLDGYENRYWDPNAGQEDANVMWSTVMALPTLNELTVSCACIHDAVHVGEARSSSLRKLTLIECNVTIEGLNKMLSAPKGLENLYLGENAFHAGQGNDVPQSRLGLPYNKLFAHNPDAFIAALAQQKDSLSQLTYTTPGSSRPRSAPVKNFKEFTQLREVALSAETRDIRAALLSHDNPPGLTSLRLDITSKELFNELNQLHHAPPSSEQEALGPEEEDVSGRLASKAASLLLPRASGAALRRLRHLHVVLTDDARGVRHTMVPTDLRRRWIRLMGAHWRDRGVRFFLYSRKRTSIIPPTLFGEERRAPRDVLLYSSEGEFSEGMETDA